MFGGQDNAVPQGRGSQGSTLNGVDDLASGLNNTPAVPGPAPASDSGLLPDTAEPVDSSVPAPAEETNDGAAAELPSPASRMPATADDLLDLKQQALQQLTPLVGHLNQSPEDRFRTTMMLIQASDNQSLLKDAYDAANAIEDEKVKAQALLDVINEINYFSQNNK